MTIDSSVGSVSLPTFAEHSPPLTLITGVEVGDATLYVLPAKLACHLNEALSCKTLGALHSYVAIARLKAKPATPICMLCMNYV